MGKRHCGTGPAARHDHQCSVPVAVSAAATAAQDCDHVGRRTDSGRSSAGQVASIVRQCVIHVDRYDIECIWMPGRDSSHRGRPGTPSLDIIAVMVDGEDVRVERTELSTLHRMLWDQLCDKS